MGGQACVFYGAAEFSRDCDIVVIVDDENLRRLTSALNELQAECIAVPILDWDCLSRGHAIHFRCKHPDALNIRVDIMARMRGCDEFELLWERRTTIEDSDGTIYQILGIEDLVKAKKTQRDRDWPMIRRLVDSHYAEFQTEPTDDRVRFWLRESRTPEVLLAVCRDFPDLTREVTSFRALLAEIANPDRAALDVALEKEQTAEKKADEEYWRPLKQELEAMRFNKRRSNG